MDKETLIRNYSAYLDAIAQNAPIAVGALQNPYKEFTFVIPANSTETLYYVLDFFRILSFSGSSGDLQVRFGESGSESDYSSAGIGYKLTQPVDRVSLRNTTASPLTITVAVAVGFISDDRLNVSGIVQVDIVSSVDLRLERPSVLNINSPVSLTSASNTVIIASNTLNSNAILQADFNNTDSIFLGASTTNLNLKGIELQAGDIFSYTGNYELRGIANSGTQSVRRIWSSYV